jgi:hypothetical protein
VNDRAEFMAWRLGLDLLVEALRGELTQFEVRLAACPRAPWLDPEPAKMAIGA